MNNECAQVGWGFWLLWVLACTVGWIKANVVASFVGLGIPVVS